jgi:hypothetical protein
MLMRSPFTVAFLSACLWLLLAATAPAATVVNYTFHTPADVLVNPCNPADVINLNGNIHVTIRTTDDGSGGYHVGNHLNSHLSGRSITTGTRYRSQEVRDEDWNAHPPFPAEHTHTYDFDINSSTGVDNFVLHMTMHETVNANGVPTATVDNYRAECRG